MDNITGQTSVEFVIILAAVASFAVFVLGAYAQFSHSQTAEYSALLNSTGNQNGAAQGNSIASQQNSSVFEYVYAPSVMYVNQSNPLRVVVYSDNATLSSMRVLAQYVELSPATYSNVTLGQIQVFTFYVVPEKAGPLNLSIDSMILTRDGSSYANTSASSYAVLQPKYLPQANSSSPTLFTPSMDEVSASVMSNLQPGGNVTYLTEWSHCGYISFWGNEYGIDHECGSSAKWYYWMLSGSCYSDGVVWATTCIYEEPVGVSLYSLGTQNKYLYNESLSLVNSTSGTILHSSLTNASNSSILENLSMGVVGNVTISGGITASVPEQDYSYYVLRRNSNYTIINSSSYNLYMQTYNNLNGVMGYYSGSEIDGSELATIQQTISAYNNVVAEIGNATSSKPPCALESYNSDISYICKPFGQIAFSNITVYISNKLPHKNSSFYLSGSYIYVK
jgi:hypothetical protein